MAKIHAQTNDDAKYSLARQYYDADITNKAIPLLSELVQKNNVKALNFLGDICYGCYFFDDISKSIRYKEKAANRGYAWAQYELAKSYHTDDKFSDKEKGAFWAGKALLSYKKQAEKGDVNSFLMIGNLYASGWLTEGTNWKEAIKWYEKAANQGNSTAMFKLGNSYWGENLDKAFFYYLNGAKLDIGEAAEKVADFFGGDFIGCVESFAFGKFT